MANEIQFQLQLQVNNGELTDTYSTSSIRIDQTTARLIRNVQEIGIAEEILDTGDIVTPGYAVFVNLDDPDADPAITNYLQVGSFVGATFYPFLKLKPGEQQLVRIGVSAATLYAKAVGGSVEMLYIIYDD